MRIESLNLEFFGHFSGKQFEFGKAVGSEPDFHVIHGPNEAGKTTFMQAYLRLLYGFKKKDEPYGFRHERKNLRVSAVLDIDGHSKLYVRKATSKGSLVDGNDVVIPESDLLSNLGGLSSEEYSKLLCIDDESIEQGGKEILLSKGDMGTLLFSAASGIDDLWSVLTQVRSRADNLYKKRTSSSRLMQIKRELADLDKLIKPIDVSIQEYNRYKSKLAKATKLTDTIKVKRDLVFNQQAQHRTRLEALPLLSDYLHYVQALQPLSAYPEAITVESDSLVKMTADYQQAVADVERLSEQLEQLKAEREAVQVDTQTLGVHAALDELQELHARYISGQLNRESLMLSLAEKKQKLALALSDVADDASERSVLDLGRADIAILARNLQALEDVRSPLSSIEEEVTQWKVKIADRQKRVSTEHEDIEEEREIAHVVEQFNARECLIEFDAAKKAIENVQNNLVVALDKLSVNTQSFEHAPVCRLSAADASECNAQLNILLTKQEAMDAEYANVVSRLEILEKQLAKLRARDGLIDDLRVNELKSQRDLAWQAHRIDYSSDSADSFETQMRLFDGVVDGRLSNASQLGELRQLEQQQIEEQVKASEIVRRVAEQAQQIEKLEHTLSSALSDAGLQADVSASMAVRWIECCEQAAADQRSLTRTREQHADVLSKAASLQERLDRLIPRQHPTFAELVAAASVIQTRYQQQNVQQQDAHKELRRLESELQDKVRQLDQCRQSHKEALDAWHSCVDELGGGVLCAQRLEHSFESLRDIRELNSGMQEKAHQLAVIEKDTELFSKRLSIVSESVGVTTGVSPDEAWSALKELSESVAASTNLLQSQDAAIEATAKALSVAVANKENLDLQKEELARQFDSTVPTASMVELRVAVDRTKQKMQLQEQIMQVQKRLLGCLSVETVQQAIDYLADFDEPTLQARLGELDAERLLVDRHYEEAVKERSLCANELSSISGDASVATLVQQKTALQLQMSEVALEHLRLSLGHRLAQAAIIRYREAHRGSMIQATEAVFSELTDGAYQQLHTEFDGKTESLKVVASGGSPKAADDLSKGTRFQLYLALRAAAYEQLVARGTTLPFICDDIFETFDEKRTLAACKVLQRIGRSGQAIYLTHHKHVVDIARDLCGDAVKVHGF